MTSKPPQSPELTRFKAINLQICDAIDEYNNAVFSGNNELAQMIHLSIQGMKRQRERLLKTLPDAN